VVRVRDKDKVWGAGLALLLMKLDLENYLKPRQVQVCLVTLRDAQEFGQFLGNTRQPKHPR